MRLAEHMSLFDSWISQYKGVLFKVVRAYAFNRHDQEDLFQELATQIWISVPRFRGNSSPSTWVYRVALNTAISWSRKELRHRGKKVPLGGADAVLEISSAGLDPKLEWLYEQIAQLGEIDRSVALLMLDGFSYQEISDALGMNASNVGVRIHRIKAHLTKESNKEFSRAI